MTGCGPANLPWYAARTTLRMLAAMLLALLFTFAAWADRSRRAELVLVPVTRRRRAVFSTSSRIT